MGTSSFVVMIAKSDSDDQSKKRRIWFGCEMGGQPKFMKLSDNEGYREARNADVPSS